MSTKNNDFINIVEVADRAKKIAGISTDKELSSLLGISTADYGQRKKRGTLLPLLIEWGVNEKVDFNYLLKGQTKGGESLDPDPEIAQLMEGARRVLTSGNPVAFDALERNIRYFDHAIAAEKRADSAERQISEMKSAVDELREEMEKLKRQRCRDGEHCGEDQSSDEKAA